MRCYAPRRSGVTGSPCGLATHDQQQRSAGHQGQARDGEDRGADAAGSGQLVLMTLTTSM
jgi:hypothetical protein